MGPVPTSIKVLSILGIIFAGLSILATPCGIYLSFRPLTPNPGIIALYKDHVYLAVYIISTIVRFSLAVLLLFGSIQSLKLKPAGRKAMILYAWILIVVTICQSILAWTYILPKMMAVMFADPTLPRSAVSLMKIGGIIGSVLSLLVIGTISGLILYFFNRTIAVNAFQGIFPATAQGFPPEFHGQNSPPPAPPANA